ncbi:MAG: hypothetical protein PHU23_13110 [Dehalococcoidales bacterium]|nr:hypothetical protein [Dehalococcoidales bacterium]
MIDSEIGVIKRYVYPMPKKSGDINFINSFDVGDHLYSIRDIETTEAITVLKNGQYYKIGRMRTPLGLVWDDKVYFLYTHVYPDENKAKNLGRQIGSILRSGIRTEEAINGDFTASDFALANNSSGLALFPTGSEIHHIKGFEANQAIAVIDKDGNIHYARYYKWFDR